VGDLADSEAAGSVASMAGASAVGSAEEAVAADNLPWKKDPSRHRVHFNVLLKSHGIIFSASTTKRFTNEFLN
jgi:hypothetical protein